MIKPVLSFVKKLERHVNRPWYPFLVAFVACIDLFIFVIPTDAVLITSAMAAPKRWVSLAAFTTAGFIIGCFLFSLMVHHYGLPAIDAWFPHMTQHKTWLRSEVWMADYGLWAIFVVSLLPIALHPIIAVAVLANVSIPAICLILLIGRIFKYGLLAWIASHSPQLLEKMGLDSKQVEEILEKKQDQPQP
jgi:membrane protein YqaA with SNARE-associated domain